MAPPGRPKTTSTPSASRLLMRACPPFIFIAWVLLLGGTLRSGHENDLPSGRSFRARVLGRRALGAKYEGAGAAHVEVSVARTAGTGQTATGPHRPSRRTPCRTR